jgi:predicted RNase H-like nuclease (RuvC/YqgF family)
MHIAVIISLIWACTILIISAGKLIKWWIEYKQVNKKLRDKLDLIQKTYDKLKSKNIDDKIQELEDKISKLNMKLLNK